MSRDPEGALVSSAACGVHVVLHVSGRDGAGLRGHAAGPGPALALSGRGQDLP